MPWAYLDGFEKSLVLTHVFENVGLQVSVDNEYCAPRTSLEGLLVSFDNLLHGIEGCLQDKNLLKILIDHLYFLDINALDAKVSA